MTAPDRLTVITHRIAGAICDQALIDGARFYGVNSETFDLDRLPLSEALDCLSSQPRPCVALAASTLIHLTAENRTRLKRFIEQKNHGALLIHSIHHEVARGSDWLAEMLDAEVSILPPPREQTLEFHISRKQPDFTGPLTGLVMGQVHPDRDSMLTIGRAQALPVPLITPGLPKLGGPMTFGQCRIGAGSVYVLAGHPAEEEYPHAGLAGWLTADHLSSVLPIMMFIRGHFGEQCWFQPTIHATYLWPNARLSSRAGSVALRDVAEEAHRLEQHVTLAVPPADFARCDPLAGRMLRQYLDNLSVVPYGNNGTPGELAVAIDAEAGGEAPRPIPQSVRRMGEFAQRTKTLWQRVIDAPDGVWHSSVLADLRRYGYRLLLARPLERDADSAWKISEGLEPASLDGPDLGADGEACGEPAFPVIAAQSDGGIDQAVIAAFLGKPVILELAPEWFGSHGDGKGQALMERMASLETPMRWTGMERLARSLYHMRRLALSGRPDGVLVEVRMFADDVVVEGVSLSEERVDLIVPRSPRRALERVTLHGAWEGREIDSPAGPFQFEILEAGHLWVYFPREIASADDEPLGDAGLGVLNRVRNMVAGVPRGLFKGGR